MTRRLVAPLLVLPLLAALALAGCARGDDVAPDVAVQPGPYPVVGLTQAASVLESVNTALAGARGVRSASRLGDRLIGPYRQIWLTGARVDHARNRTSPAPGDFALVKLLVPRAPGWPRFFVAVGQVEGESTPALRVLRSADARTPYGLWAQASMLPGATLPQTAAAATGVAALPAEATAGLVMSPARAVSGLAAYLTAAGGGAGDAGRSGGRDGSGQFRRSSYGDQVVQQVLLDRKALKAVATVSSTHRAARTAPLALRTADGGALVVAELEQQYTLRTRSGRGVALTDQDLIALAGGKKQFSKSFTRRTVEVVVLDVPPAGGGQVSVVAAQQGDVAATAK